ncbi:2-dehydropantoate 2-reductase [Cysteiniphilum halobium]|uniref:2-dehydropantoate 2-reductase n=1 Tax=Cysteiniphilum halobium TaxID=2219059 RepID=UPI0013C33362|nr:2-dehydropantoate 2-reductase [Cysteiniphilum halobium]
MKVSIIGVGAIGGFIAVRLQNAGIAVQLVLKQKPMDQSVVDLKVSGGMTLSGSFNDLVDCTEDIDGDLIFICTKSTANSALFESLTSIDNKWIVLLQNGIGEEEKLLQNIDKSNTVIGAVSHIKVSKVGNEIMWHNQLCNIDYAYLQPRDNVSVDRVLSKAFIEANKKKSVLDLRFHKLLVSAPCNGASVIFQADMNALANNPQIAQMIREIALEVITVAHAYNIKLNIEAIDNLLIALAKPEYSGAYFSMWYDYNENKPMELGSIYENVLKMACLKDLEMPTLEHLYEQLMCLENTLIIVDGSISLRLLRLSDAQYLHQLKVDNKAHLQSWHDWANKPFYIEDSHQFIAQAQINFLQRKKLILGVFSNNSLIGMCSFNTIDEVSKNAEVGYWLAQSYVGRGIITAAIHALSEYAKTSLSLASLSISVATHNTRSRRVAERLNFEYICDRPNHERVVDKIYDHALYRLALKE